MRLNQFLLLALFITIFSCSSDSDNSPGEEPDNENITLLKKITYSKDTDEEYEVTFNYDENKLTRVDEGDGDSNVYTYDNNGNLIKDEAFEDNELSASVVLEYNSEDKLVMFTENFLEPSGLDDRKYKHMITYNNDGTLTDEIFVSFDNADFELDDTETITLNGDNITKIVSVDANDPTDIFQISITFDDKNGKYKNIHAIEVLNILSKLEFGALIYGNTNNITSYTESGSNTNNPENFEYSYNENGYPASAISSTEGETDETIDFVYE